MKPSIITRVTAAIALMAAAAQAHGQEQPQDKQPTDERVIVGNDTVSMIIPQRNIGRHDRGLRNYLFIPKGQWAIGLTASYGELNTDDVQILSIIKDLDQLLFPQQPVNRPAAHIHQGRRESWQPVNGF